MDANFIRERITQLRLKKGISEYQMSYDLGHSRGYIYNISSGKALPPMKEFLAICDYFNISPQQFFDESTESPQLIQRAITGMQQLNEKDLIMLIGFIERLLHNEEGDAISSGFACISRRFSAGLVGLSQGKSTRKCRQRRRNCTSGILETHSNAKPFIKKCCDIPY